MRRKRKVWYHIRAKGMWWCGKKIGLVSDLNSVDYDVASCTRVMKTAKKAFAHAKTLPPGSVLTRLFFKKGKRYALDFVSKRKAKTRPTKQR